MEQIMHHHTELINSSNNLAPRFSLHKNEARETTARAAQPHRLRDRIYDWADLIGKGRS
jgi:hypothetical protein